MQIIRFFVYFLLFCFFSFTVVFAQIASPALEVLSKYPKVRDFTMSPAGDEAYVTLQSLLEEISTIVVIRKKDGEWQKCEKVSFSSKYRDLEASLSPDGLTLYFVSNRPLDSSEKAKDFDIWFVTRQTLNSEWSAPKNLGAPINSEKDEFYPSVAANGNMYFTREPLGPKNTPDIMFSKKTGEKYSEPVALSDAVNTDSHEYNAYIAPDESFLIFGAYQREDGYGSGDLYISYRNADGSWGKAKNLGEGINSQMMDFCPFVDWRTKTLYFTSRRSSVRNSGFTDLDTFEKELLKYENGFTRIYKISFAQTMAEMSK